MDIISLRAKINKPISEEQPIGIDASEESLYEFIDEQMMKVGSLSHGSVQWKKVEEGLIDLLSEKTKDIKLLIYLLQCFYNHNSAKSLAASVFVLSDFMENYWESCYPFLGKKGGLARRKFFNQIIQRLDLALDKIEFSASDLKEFKALNEATELLDNVLTKISYDSDDTGAVIIKIKRKIRESEERSALNDETDKKDVNTSSTKTNQNIEFDTSSTKAAKQTLLKMADFIEEQEDSIELAIRLRRHALWSSITSLPDHSDYKTLVAPLPLERVTEYWDSLKQADLSLWKRVETTLTMTPYWFDGHYLSYQIAEKLGYKSCAHAILTEIKKFLHRLPEMYELKFKDESDFISNECKLWLEEEDDNSTGRRRNEKSFSDSWGNRKQTITDLAKSDGLESALLMINTEISVIEEARDHYYWRLISIELLIEHNLESLASQQLQQFLSEIESMSVSQWEPSLLKRIKKYTPAK